MPDDKPRDPDGHITVSGKPMAYWLPLTEYEPDEWTEHQDDDNEADHEQTK